MKLKLFFIIFLTILTFFQLNAQYWYPSTLIRDLNSNPADYFGLSVDIFGDYLICGTSYAGYGSFGSNYWDHRFGAAYIFKKNAWGQWNETQKLTAYEGNSECLFGAAVAIEGDYAFVGSPKNDLDAYGQNQMNNAGAVYIFVRDSGEVWHLSRKILANDRHAGDQFGYSIDIQNNTLFIGALEADAPNSNTNPLMQNTGAVYIFKRQTNGNWTQQQKILAPNKSSGDAFGYSVDVNNDKLIIGASLWENTFLGGFDFGAAYIYQKDSLGSWSFVQDIYANDPTNESYFGSAVAINDSFAIIAASNKSYFDSLQSKWLTKAGAAYIFEIDSLNHWQEVKKITHPFPHQYLEFAKSVATFENQIFIGNQLDFTDTNDIAGGNYGSVRIWQRNQQGEWYQARKITPFTPSMTHNNYFGYSMAVDTNQLVVGMPGYSIVDSLTGYDIDLLGAAYVYQTTKPTSIEKRNTLNFDYFPNPVTDKLHITFKDFQERVTVNQYNSIGKLISSSLHNSCLHINTEIKGNPGIYFIEIVTKNKERKMIKVIKL